MQETKYYCDKCGKEITQAQNLKTFIRIYDEAGLNFEKPSYCKQCTKEIRKVMEKEVYKYGEGGTTETGF